VSQAQQVPANDVFAHDGVVYQVGNINVQYTVHNNKTSSMLGALVDGGANGGLSGADVRVIETSSRRADVTGIGDQTLQGLPIALGAALIQTKSGYIIGMFHQHAHIGKEKTIHSANQMRKWGVNVDDTPQSTGGSQHVYTSKGHIIPLSIRGGLAYMDMVKPTDNDMSTYPHVIFTSDNEWDPHILDDEYSHSDFDADLLPLDLPDPRVNQYGEILNRKSEYYHASTEDTGLYEYVNTCLYEVKHGRRVRTEEHDFKCLRPNFGWTTTNRIKKTLENTTKFARAQDCYPMRKHYKTRFPAANVNRLNRQ
jgi:hypothetical protein